LDSPQDETKLIQQYLLNETPLYGNNKPKLWIHTKYDVNARKGGRNTTECNSPYISMTLKTIVNHCSNDFNVCLIDDAAFERLLSGWDYGNIQHLPEPEKSRVRLLGLLKLVYVYGGIVVPNTFICMKNLYSFYEYETHQEPRACVFANRNNEPDFFMFAAPKKCIGIKCCIDIVQESLRRSIPLFEFPSLARLLIETREIRMIDGKWVGLCTNAGQPVLLDDLFTETPMDFAPDILGIHVSQDELLSRTCYNWFAEMSPEEISSSQVNIAKYLMNEYSRQLSQPRLDERRLNVVSTL